MKWGGKKSSSLINRVFPVSWFSKFKRNYSPKQSKNSVLDIPSPNPSFYGEGRFYSVDEDDAYWRISFGGDDRIPPRRGTGGGVNPLWQHSGKELDNHVFSDFKRFGLAGAEVPRGDDECRNFTEMVSDIKKMRERGVKATAKDERETTADGGAGERATSPVESKPMVLNSKRSTTKNRNPEPDRPPDRKLLKEIRMKKTEPNTRKAKENSRGTIIKTYSPRTECKIRALEEMKKARARAKKKAAPKQRVADEGTVFDSFAVVKSSSDPHRDFKDSMVEMIREKGIGHPDDLEELLACYLTLNADEYHDLIISVFRQVWTELKGTTCIGPLMKNVSYFDC